MSKKQPEKEKEFKRPTSERPVMFIFGLLMIASVGLSGVAAIVWAQVFVLFVATMVTSLLFGVLTVAFMAKTNAWTELKSSLRGTPVLLIFRRDKTVSRTSCLYKVDCVETAKDGTFMMTPDSVYRDKKTGLPTMAALSTYGVTLEPKYYAMASGLRKQGIKGFEHAADVNKELSKEDKTLATTLNMRETIRFDDFVNFLKEHINPHYIQALIERNTALNLKGVRQFPIAWISMMTVLMVGAAIAYVIIMQQAPPAAAAPPTLVPNLVG